MDSMEDRTRVALGFMKKASRDTFVACAQSAEDLAQKVEINELPMDAPTALRLLAVMFRSSSQRP
jgi:hypothetical protein